MAHVGNTLTGHVPGKHVSFTVSDYNPHPVEMYGLSCVPVFTQGVGSGFMFKIDKGMIIPGLTATTKQ